MTILTPSLYERMKVRYAPPEYELMFEVSNSTGGGHQRSADAIALGTFPSRGMPILGFEFKASRADWLRELKDPAKAETIHKYCDSWWLVVEDKEIVKDGELPKGWGLIVPHGDGLKAKVVADPIDSVVPLKGRGFLAAMIRRAGEAARDAEVFKRLPANIEAEVSKRVKEGVEIDTARWKRAHEQLQEWHKDLQDKVKSFEEITGVSLSNPHGSWGPVPNFAEIGRALTALAKLHNGDRRGYQTISNRLADMRKECAELTGNAEKIEQLLAELGAEIKEPE